ncbi:hypothetical protein NM208_g3473 [Fusarium decemcellulare]|uniref:Uncharacterized protein n=1 Tax=Fusarium decemcellulare TaxID=57161 RepID=A0ACC1SP20_9HYPO|nr:hypothetical protein NM208_g3473 [Fusarium decemcellulare]
MDPLTAVSLASNIISFIDFSAKVISGAVEIHATFSGDSAGLTEENRSTLAVVTEMRHLASKLQPPGQSQLTGNEKALCALAKECEDLSQKIIGLIEKARSKGGKSRLSSLKAACRSRWHDGKRQELLNRLSDCRDQLGLHLNYISSVEVKSRLDNIISSARKDTSKLEYLYSQADECRKGVTISSLSITAKSQIQSLLDISAHASDLIIQHRILANLSFPDMHRRYDEVPEAHSKTLQWIFGDDADGILDVATDPEKHAARDTILTWLSSGNDIFHVSGKLGSGKSTLMKFLYEHESTRIMLEQWAGPRKLICAHFFFWKPGSALQKSLTGLYRSLLYSVLQAAPELIPAVFPEIWLQLKSTPWQAITEIRFLERVIRRAFSQLILDASLYKSYRICFFIDGLDEYEETLQDDAKCLVELLCGWASSSQDSVKLCVSSREYNVFMNAFAQNKHIRVHEITRRDMEQYVSIKLSPMREEGGKAELTKAIVHNSSGIFLWVALVVRRIRDQIENGHGLASLKREIDALPKEMEGLLALILNSLPDLDLKEAYQTFSMVMEWDKYSGGFLSIMSYSFLDEYNQDSTFVFDEDFAQIRPQPADLTTRRDSALKRLNGCCRGLVEAVLYITYDGTDQDTNDYAIVFTHRCVSEFLMTDLQQDHMLRLLPGFNAVDAISHLVLAELLVDPHLVQRQDQWGSLALLTPLRIGSNLDHAPYRFLEAFCAALSKCRNMVTSPPVTARVWSVIFVHLTAGVYCGFNELGRCDGVNYLCPLGDDLFPHPIYHAALLGNNDYVRWKLTHDVPIRAHFNMEIVLHAMLVRHAECKITDMISIVGLLIHNGLSPNAVVTIWAENFHKVETCPSETHGFNMTVWHHLLLLCCPWRERTDPGLVSRFGCTLEVFLEHGADPYFELTTEKSEDNKMVFRLVLERERRKLLLSSNVSYCPFEATSLIEYIRFCGFQNEANILQLIDRNMGQGISENIGS